MFPPWESGQIPVPFRESMKGGSDRFGMITRAHFLSVYYILSNVFSIFSEAIDFILPTTLSGRYHYYFCFADEETAQRGVKY